MQQDGFFSVEELRKFGFSSVSRSCRVSRLTRFHACSGRIGVDVRIDDYVILTGEIILEDQVHISPFCFLNGTGGGISMGKNSGIGSHSVVLTKSDDYSQVGIQRQKVKGPVNIGTNAVLGTNVIILPNLNIGEGASVGARCVIGSSVDPQARVYSEAAQVRIGKNDLAEVSEPLCGECLSWFAVGLGHTTTELMGEGIIDSLQYLEIVELLYALNQELGVKARQGDLGDSWVSIVKKSHEFGLCART